ncbi:MAG TPA: hypothetical protein DEB17_09160 [Chlorobaculum sp.]|uniref:Uncharacterized protein n=1 Tax=Chlorobaculum tepidum (strain ATCC 49652 / DSM 12025 / NBRC 103806 / TLS) TaxID=194439 RepID=Q8KB77_CHLTE|nr:hypothetical protein CT1912 [Chlorobaculum tepidum TLS]HBU24135.1 hypothetical protein [Chlorobaculum sp.]
MSLQSLSSFLKVIADLLQTLKVCLRQFDLFLQVLQVWKSIRITLNDFSDIELQPIVLEYYFLKLMM